MSVREVFHNCQRVECNIHIAFLCECRYASSENHEIPNAVHLLAGVSKVSLVARFN